MSTRVLSVAALLSAIFGSAACGSEPPARPDQVVERYYAASQDPKARCATLSRSSLEQFGDPAECPKRTIASAGRPPRIAVEKVQLRGNEACVRFQVEDGGKGIFSLVREGESWKIDGFQSGLEPSGPTAEPCGPARGPRRE